MTDIQKIKIEQKRLEFDENINQYLSFGSRNYCSFSVYSPIDPNDKSVTVVSTLIENISNDNIPNTKQVYYNILNDGTILTLGLVMTSQQILNYLTNLTKIE